MDDEGQKLRVTGVHRNGRRAFDAVSKARLIESCLQPGASVAQLALDHGVNANLLWNWIRKQRPAQKATLPQPPSTPAFIPVHIDAAATEVVPKHDSACELDLRPHDRGLRLPKPDGTGLLSSPARVNASLPNGVKLTLECGDMRALTAIIGALCDVQTGR